MAVPPVTQTSPRFGPLPGSGLTRPTGVLLIAPPVPPPPPPDPGRIPVLIRQPLPPPPPPSGALPESGIPPGYRAADPDERMTARERADAYQRFGQALGIALLPEPVKPINPSIPSGVYTLGVVSYFALGAGVAQGHLKASPIALAGWFVLPEPFGFQDPRVYGLSEKSFAPHVYRTIKTFLVEDLALGRRAAQSELAGDAARRDRLYAETRARLAGLDPDQLIGLATANVLPPEWRGLALFATERRALRDELTSRGARFLPGNRLKFSYDASPDPRQPVGVGNQHGDP